jgi:hypothetical protein
VPTLVRVPLTSVPLPRMKLSPALSARSPDATKTPVAFPVAAEWASRRTAPDPPTPKPDPVLLAASGGGFHRVPTLVRVPATSTLMLPRMKLLPAATGQQPYLLYITRSHVDLEFAAAQLVLEMLAPQRLLVDLQLLGAVGLSEAESRSVLDERALVCGRHIFGWYFL